MNAARRFSIVAAAFCVLLAANAFVGAAESETRPAAAPLAAQGYAVLQPNYRGSALSNNPP